MNNSTPPSLQLHPGSTRTDPFPESPEIQIPPESKSSTASPRKMTALFAAAKHGKGAIDKAMRFLLDSEDSSDHSFEPIWLLGVPYAVLGGQPSGDTSRQEQSKQRMEGRRRHSVTSTPVSGDNRGRSGTTSDARTSPDPGAAWPPAFYADFTSRVWLTYRSQLGSPIRDGHLAELELCSSAGFKMPSGNSDNPDHAATGHSRKVWPWAGEKIWKTDTGWGCMLRTGQSLLANALVDVLLGRDWRRSPHPVATPDYAVYVRLLTWFLDTPSPHSPFSVHRMALAGKELGTNVGQWFGPSVAAGAIKTLVNAFPECGLAVVLGNDSTLYQSEVFTASHDLASKVPHKQHTGTWGGRPVLLLLGIRLGLDGVHPIYYDTIKMLFTFPQSVGISGGRPSSSYYFVGSQGDNLFYLDPHNTRPAIPLRSAPPRSQARPGNDNRTEQRSYVEAEGAGRLHHHATGAHLQDRHHRTPTSPSSNMTVSSNFLNRAPAAPSPLQKQISSSSTESSVSGGTGGAHGEIEVEVDTESAAGLDSATEEDRSPPPSYHEHGQHRLAGASQGNMPARPSTPPLDPFQLHYCNAYSAAELRTFHCERVRKMPLSGLDPSMLVGFVCRDEKDWWDFRQRAAELPKAIFSIQEEPPTWPSDLDDSMSLKSVSDSDSDVGVEDDCARADDTAQSIDLHSESASSRSNQSQT